MSKIECTKCGHFNVVGHNEVYHCSFCAAKPTETSPFLALGQGNYKFTLKHIDRQGFMSASFWAENGAYANTELAEMVDLRLYVICTMHYQHADKPIFYQE